MPDQLELQQSLLKITKAMINMPAQTLLNGLVLLSIVAIGGVGLPGIFATLATTVGVNLLSNMLERVARGDNVSEDEIREIVDNAIKSSGIENLVTSDEFYRVVARLFRRFDLLEYAIKSGENTVVRILYDQFASQKEILEEIQSQISYVKHQLSSLATRGQIEEIIALLQTIEKNQTAPLGMFHSTPAAQLFSVQLIDKQINDEIEKLRKSRYFLEFDRVGFSISFGVKLICGELASGTILSRCRGLAWCSRVLSTSENLDKSEEYYTTAKELGGDAPEIEIAYAFILSQKGDVSAALNILANINTPIAQSAALMIIANRSGNEKAIDWFDDSGLEITNLDADGRRFYLALLLELSKWEAALEYLNKLVDQDFEESPILYHFVAITYLLQAVPVELRKDVYAHIPLEVSTFPLSSSAKAIVFRKNACRYFLTASEAFARLDLPTAANIDNQYALWLELTDQEHHVAAKQKLENLLREPQNVIRYINFGIQFGIKKLNLDLIEREINQRVALRGGYTLDTALARFALVYTKKPEDAAFYISQYREQLAEFLDKRYLLSFQIEMFLRAGQIDQAKDGLNKLISEGISDDEKDRTQKRISELEGSDAVEIRKEQFRISNALVDLVSLVDELEKRGDWNSIGEYGQLLFDKTHFFHDAERLVYAWSITNNYEKVLGLLKGNDDLLSQSKMLQFGYCTALYYEGELLEARSELRKLGEARDGPNYRALQINLAISLGDWSSLLTIIGDESACKDQRNAQELLFAAQLAINLGSSHAKELIFAAVGKGENDAGVYASAYFLASSAGWENENGIFQWLEKAVELSDDDGPIQRVTIRDFLDRKPEWDRRESDTWNLFNRGEIPMFVAARSLNRTLIDLMLFPALTNRKQRDPRRRGVIAAYSGNRRTRVIGSRKSIGLDVTALLTLSLLNLVDKVFDLFETIYLPHSTLSWLFDEKMRSSFHQPSRIRNAKKISLLLLSGSLEKLASSAISDSELSSQIGDELAELLAEATQANNYDNVQHIVVRSSPVHQLTPLMDTEADLTAYASCLASCQSIVEKLREKGYVTMEEERIALTYLRLHEKLWPNQPEINDNATLYLDDLTVDYFIQIGILDKLSAAGFRAIISPRKVKQADDLISSEEISESFTEIIERIRFSVNVGINSGKIKIGRKHQFDIEDKQLSQHPTLEVIALAEPCDSLIIDDRYFNQREIINTDDLSTPIFTTLDLLDTLVDAGIISAENKSASITLLRHAGYIFLPVEYVDLVNHLMLSKVKDDKVCETTELKAIRESVLQIRMSNWLQLPQESFWLDKSTQIFLNSLHRIWELESDISNLRTKSNWIAEQIDIRGWAHRFEPHVIEHLIKKVRGMHILFLLMSPRNVSEKMQKEYLDWANDNVLTPIKQLDPDLYSWIINWQKTQIAEITSMNIENLKGRNE